MQDVPHPKGNLRSLREEDGFCRKIGKWSNECCISLFYCFRVWTVLSWCYLFFTHLEKIMTYVLVSTTINILRNGWTYLFWISASNIWARKAVCFLEISTILLEVLFYFENAENETVRFFTASLVSLAVQSGPLSNLDLEPAGDPMYGFTMGPETLKRWPIRFGFLFQLTRMIVCLLSVHRIYWWWSKLVL